SFRIRVAVPSKWLGPAYSRPGSILLPWDRILYQPLADKAAPIIKSKTDSLRSFSHSCNTCNPNLVASDSTWDGLAMANLVEHLGGAIVSPHSQSGIHVLHMIRILRERGKLDLVKGIIIPESAIGLATFANAGITPNDFDHIPFLLMNGDYRPGTARVANREMIAAI